MTSILSMVFPRSYGNGSLTKYHIIIYVMYFIHAHTNVCVHMVYHLLKVLFLLL